MRPYPSANGPDRATSFARIGAIVSRTFKPDIKVPLVKLAVFSLLLGVFINQIIHGRHRFVLVMLVAAAILLIRQLWATVVVDDTCVRLNARTFPWEQILEAKVLPPRRFRGPVMMVVAGVMPRIFVGRVGLKVPARKEGATKWVKLPRVSDPDALLSAIQEKLSEAA